MKKDEIKYIHNLAWVKFNLLVVMILSISIKLSDRLYEFILFGFGIVLFWVLAMVRAKRTDELYKKLVRAK